MREDRLKDLAELARAVRSARESRLKDIATEETRIRQNLAMLADHRVAAAPPAGREGLAVHRVGADMLWRGWLDQTERALQIELAQVLARKEEARRSLQRAHGRSEAAASLLETERRATRARAEITKSLREQQTMMLKSAGNHGPR